MSIQSFHSNEFSVLGLWSIWNQYNVSSSFWCLWTLMMPCATTSGGMLVLVLIEQLDIRFVSFFICYDDSLWIIFPEDALCGRKNSSKWLEIIVKYCFEDRIFQYFGLDGSFVCTHPVAQKDAGGFYLIAFAQVPCFLIMHILSLQFIVSLPLPISQICYQVFGNDLQL